MAELSNVEITINKDCEDCKGTGGSMRPPGSMVFDRNDILKQPVKDIVITPEQAQKMIDDIPKEIVGVTDRATFVPCKCCGGTGKIKSKMTLEELKSLLT